MRPDFLDRYARGDTLCHRWPALFKLGLTLVTILTAVVLPISQWPVLGCLACLVFAGLSVARIPMDYLIRRLLLIAPMLVGIALSVLLSQGSAGLELAATLVARAFVAFLASLWLVNTTPFEVLLLAAQRLGMPSLFAAMLAMMYRYLFVIFDELAKMNTARRARSFGGRFVVREWIESAQLIGRLLIRSVDRAERIHGAMCARGWDGRVRVLVTDRVRSSKFEVQKGSKPSRTVTDKVQSSR